MKTRIITALVLIPLLVLVLISNVHVITGAIAVVSLIGLFEFYKATGLSKHKLLCALGYAAALTVVLRFYIPADLYMPIFYVFMLLLFCIMLKAHKTVSVTEASMLIFSVIYVPFFLSMLIGIRDMEFGYLYLWVVFIGAFATDTCAYFSGVFLGRHKLCPEISPKKTIEGAVGGTLGSILVVLLYGIVLEKFFSREINYVSLGILGALCAVISQIGDLTASIIKRKFGVKDYGNLFPGHGGILDRLDSVIAVAPLVYIYLAAVGI